MFLLIQNSMYCNIDQTTTAITTTITTTITTEITTAITTTINTTKTTTTTRLPQGLLIEIISNNNNI